MKWLKHLVGKLTSGAETSAPRRRTFRPRVERLDERLVPTRVVADFLSNGLWRWVSGPGATGTWTQLTTASPLEVDSADNGDVVASFTSSPIGLWRWTQAGGWTQLTPSIPDQFEVSAGGDILGDFGFSLGGLWRWSIGTGSWQQLSTVNPEALDVANNGTAFIDFGSVGLWRWNIPGGMVQLTTLNPEEIGVVLGAPGHGEVFGDFGLNGVWRWKDGMGWQFLSSSNPEDITVSDNGPFFGDFGAIGLWRWAGGIWGQLTPFSPTSIAATPTGEVWAVFGGALSGTWFWSPPTFGLAAWGYMTSQIPQKLVVDVNGEVFADFGTIGLWRIRTSIGLPWQQIAALNPFDISSRG